MAVLGESFSSHLRAGLPAGFAASPITLPFRAVARFATRNFHLFCVVLLLMVPGSGVGLAENTGRDPAVGLSKSTNQTTGAGITNTMRAPARPSVIYITDFRLDAPQVEQQKRIGSGKARGPLGVNPLHRLDKDPEDEARQLVRVLSDAIIKQLKHDGFHAVALTNVAAEYQPGEAGGRLQFQPGSLPLPKDGWLVCGWFEKVQEGNSAVEATVGFGKGQGSATADVAVTDLAKGPAQPFLVMGSGSRAKKAPGGLLMMNPYVMAAKFVVSKRQGAEKEVRSLGVQIAQSLVRFIERPEAATPGGTQPTTNGR